MQRLVHSAAFPGFRAAMFNGILIIRLQVKSLDAGFSRRERHEILSLIASHPKAIIDFGTVISLGAAALDSVSQWVLAAGDHGTQMRLVQCSKRVYALLQLLRIPRAVPVDQTLYDALVTLNGGDSTHARFAVMSANAGRVA